jgi:hypothetical protein
MEEPTEQEPSWTRRLEQASKLTLGATAVFYVLGLVVASLHLMRFGVFSLSLVRPHYVVAGIWPLLPLAFLAALVSWTIMAYQEDERPRRADAPQRRWWHGALYLNALVMPALAWLAVNAMAINYVVTSDGVTPWSFRQILWGALGVLGFSLLLVLLSAATWTGAHGPRVALRIVRGVAFGSLLLLCLLGYLRFFVDHIYPVIPSRIGGGKPMPVTVVLKASDNVAALGLTPRPGNPRALRCELVLDGDKTYVFRTLDEPRRTLELSKDLVAAMIIDDRR